MYINKNFSPRALWRFSGGHIIWIGLWATFITALYHFTQWTWLSVPWLPLSVIGTAVAFYLGFKNNQAYDRLWEGRKIWGAIVNSSRNWGSISKSFVSNYFCQSDVSEEELKQVSKTLIYRHIAWLYALRSQLLIPTPWEHINQNVHVRKVTERRRQTYGVGLLGDDITEKQLRFFLPPSEHDRLINHTNTATQIIDQQSQDLQRLHSQGLIDDFRHMEMQKVLYHFYEHQGKAERIKKFPLPRQYGALSLIFVVLFILLVPLGMVSEFDSLGGDYSIWLCIPFSILVGWVYILMELVGDYSENPFEGLGNDVPMLSLCRVIEIDLREMIGDEDIPEGIKAVRGVLM